MYPIMLPTVCIPSSFPLYISHLSHNALVWMHPIMPCAVCIYKYPFMLCSVCIPSCFALYVFLHALLFMYPIMLCNIHRASRWVLDRGHGQADLQGHSLWEGPKLHQEWGFHDHSDWLEIGVRLHQHPEDHQCPRDGWGAYTGGTHHQRLQWLKIETVRGHIGGTLVKGYNELL